MKNAFSEWKSIERSIQRTDEKLFLFDFDGTLSKIVRHPDQAKLDEKVKPLLLKLSETKGVKVGIISGRSLPDIKNRVGMRNTIYAGNHGLEAEGNGFVFVHPKAPSMRRKLEKILAESISLGKGIKGLFIENKGLTGSIHYRNVVPADLGKVLSLVNQIKSQCEGNGFSLRTGKKVFEIIPDLKWDKGVLVRWLDNKFGCPLIVYVGDDTTDEDVFRALQKNEISVRVGEIAGSAASYFLPSRKDVAPFLKRVIDL